MKPLPKPRHAWIATALLTLLACREPAVRPTPPPPSVTVAQPVEQELSVFAEFPASLKAISTVDIRARVTGALESCHFTDGATVEKGQLLFQIEPDSYEQALNAAKADLARAEAARELAQKRFARLDQALKKNAVSQIDVEVAAAELSQSAASVKQAQARLENAQLQLDYTTIHAPISGRIATNIAGTGNLVGYGEPTLLTQIVDDSKIFVEFEVPERDIIRYLEARANQDAAKLVMAKPIGLRLADGTLFDQSGRIDFIANTVDPQTRTNEVRAVFDNPEGTLAAGLYGLVRIPIGPNPQKPRQKTALTLPSVAVQRDIGGPFVWTVDEQNQVHRQAVTLGRKADNPDKGGQPLSVILSGLTPQDRVIIAGIQRAREGAVVAPQAATPPSDKPQPAAQ